MEESDVSLPLAETIESYSMCLNFQPDITLPLPTAELRNTIHSVQQSLASEDNQAMNIDKTYMVPPLPKQPLSISELQNYQSSRGLYVQISPPSHETSSRAFVSPGCSINPGNRSFIERYPEGSTVPVTLRPSAPTSSIEVNKLGGNGVGFNLPDQHLKVLDPPPSNQNFFVQNNIDQNLQVCSVIANSSDMQNMPIKSEPVLQEASRLLITQNSSSSTVNSHNPSSSIVNSHNSSTKKVKEVSTSLDDFYDVPGLNQKGTVDQTTYVNSLVVDHHPMFTNIDSYAERCVACVFRKLKNNLKDLQKLYRLVSNQEEYGPGDCIIVSRAKDSRITVTRSSQDGTKSTKKIHPHLAMIQIFSNPQVQNVNHLQPIPDCKSPFLTGALLPEMCINPFHYQSISSQSSKSPSKKAVVRTKAVDIKEEKLMPQFVPPILKEPTHMEFESDFDLLSDSSSDSHDLQEIWSNLSFSQKAAQPIEIKCDDSELLGQLTFLNLKRKWDSSETSVVPSQSKIKLHLKTFNLSDVSDATHLKPRVRSRHVSTKEDKLEALTSNTIVANGNSEPNSCVPDHESMNHGTESTINQKQEYTENKKKEDEIVIKNLLDDIKESFETDFYLGHMDMDRFGGQDFQEFSISNTFSMPVFNEPAQDPMSDLVIDDLTTVNNMQELNLIQDSTLPSLPLEDGQVPASPMIVDAWTDDS